VSDAEVICTDEEGRSDFDRLHSRCFEHAAIACAFDLVQLDGQDLRRKPLSERKAALLKLLNRSRGGIQYVWHVDADGAESFTAACELGLEGIVSDGVVSASRRSSCHTQ
jgi:bifunctional non-homologous end joining protein LigD